MVEFRSGVRPEFRTHGNFGRFRCKFRSAIADVFGDAELTMTMKPKLKHRKLGNFSFFGS